MWRQRMQAAGGLLAQCLAPNQPYGFKKIGRADKRGKRKAGALRRELSRLAAGCKAAISEWQQSGLQACLQFIEGQCFQGFPEDPSRKHRKSTNNWCMQPESGIIRQMLCRGETNPRRLTVTH